MTSYQKRMLEAAEKYLAAGYSVIPVGGDKKPLVEWKIFQSQRPTAEQLREWIEKYSEINIGIVTGKISDLAVVDIEKGGSVEGLPITRIVKTGGGGWHYYYRFIKGIENKTRIRELTDIRGEGGYVVAPPSIHKSGAEYFWVDENEEIADFPDQLRQEISKNRQSNWKSVVGGIEKGSRNTEAARLFGKIIPAFRKDEIEEVWKIGSLWNQQNRPPLSERELRSVFESIGNRHYSRAESAKNFSPILLAKLMETEFSDVQWIVEKIIPSAGITVISGHPGGFKTWIILEMAKKVASGNRFLENFGTNKTGVLLIDEENGLRMIKNRLKKLGVDNNLPIHFLSYAGFKLGVGPVDGLIKFCHDNDVKLVFFDSLVRFHTGEENSAKDMASVFEILRQLTKESITVVITHHNRKSNALNSDNTPQEMRGSSDILASIDCHISVKRKENTLEIKQTKLREDIELKPFRIVVETSKNGVSLKYDGEIEGGLNKSDEAREAVLEFLKSCEEPPMQKEIIQMLEKGKICGKSTAKAIIKQLVKSEEIIEKRGEQNRWHYSIAETKES